MSFDFQSSFDLVKTINVKITVSGIEGNHTPERLINNDNFDPARRWESFGTGQWIDFQFNQPIPLYGLDISWYKGNERRETFEILTSMIADVLWKGMSTGYTGSYETYKFKDRLVTKNIRILCRGNTENEMNAITSIKFRLDPITEQGVLEFPSCPPGQHWHTVLNRCVADVITEPPNIIITEPIQTVKHGDHVMIEGSQTTDPNGATMFFEWVQTAGDLVKTSNTLEPNLLFTAPTIDTELEFRLNVRNSGNISAYKDAKVVVRAAIPKCPTGEYWDEESKKCVSINEIHAETNPIFLDETPTLTRSSKTKNKTKSKSK